MSKINIIPIFVPHLGCPNDCVFCNQKRITGVETFSKEDIDNKLKFYLNLFEDSNKDVEIAFFGGSFTAIDKKLQCELLEKAQREKNLGKVQRIRISTRPDCIDEEILEYLKEYSVDIIELGVQSLDEDVLCKSKRGHSKEIVFKASKLIKDWGFTLGLQQMVGLPGDNEEKSIKTSLQIISMEPDFVRIYPTLVIKNTELESLYLNKLYAPLELNEAVSIVTKLMLLYDYYNIKIIRIGLQSTEDLQFGKDVIAGPLHDAFRELCESEKLYLILKSTGLTYQNSISIKARGRNISLLAGQKGINKEKLKDLFKVDNISLKADKNLNEDEILIENSKGSDVIKIKKKLIKL